MTRYYFYITANHAWYTLTAESLREQIEKAPAFPIAFIFQGSFTTAENKDVAEKNFKTGTNIEYCSEPACMLDARREYFKGYAKHIQST